MTRCQLLFKKDCANLSRRQRHLAMYSWLS